ncbi:MAG TPA: DUF5715 family protein, partial [Candidatus Acidoferrales bacterium]|nr:DUF5715 family protein [Candidatus Acidoferrales bacterium]
IVFVIFLTSTLSWGASVRRPYRVGTPRTRSTRRTTHRRVVVWNPVLRGSHESLLRQNEEINRLSLPRIANDLELQELELREELVPLHDSRSMVVASNIDSIRRYCRPWTRDFVEDLSQAYFEKFHKPLYITSAVRTVEQQARLRRWNSNAAPIEGDTASSHLAGLTIDIGKRGMTRREKDFVNGFVLPLQNAGLVEAAEERRQACYHIMVSDRYTGWREEQQRLQSPLNGGPTTAQTTAP